MKTVDTLLSAKWVIPVEPSGQTIEDATIAIKNGDIVGLVTNDAAQTQYRASETLDFPHHAIIPGLVNTHTHAAMTLLRGFADDLPLETWLNQYIWPAESRWVGTEFVKAGTTLAAAEMIQSGTTCFSDMYFFPDAAAEAAVLAGIRACIGLIMIDFPSAWAPNSEEYLNKGLDLHDKLRHEPLVTTAFAPHAPYSVSDAPLEKIRVLADELDIPIHMHVHETEKEINESMARFGVRPLERLSQLEMLSPKLLAVHMTQLLQGEIEALAENGCHVLHCPESNLKLASGLCPVNKLQNSGVNVALGTDGTASNNDLDMFGEMRMASLLAKGISGDPTALPAHETLKLATLNGARALGMEERIGSIVPGKAADLVAIDLSGIVTQPVYEPVSQIVYSASRDQVTDVWVGGRRVLDNRHLTTMDEQDLQAEAKSWGKKIQSDKQFSS
ncbi:TRZ/ATZ family hydrolase [Pseudomonadota bacterium]